MYISWISKSLEWGQVTNQTYNLYLGILRRSFVSLIVIQHAVQKIGCREVCFKKSANYPEHEGRNYPKSGRKKSKQEIMTGFFCLSCWYPGLPRTLCFSWEPRICWGNNIKTLMLCFMSQMQVIHCTEFVQLAVHKSGLSCVCSSFI